jgi:hypothetical protein
MMHIIAKDSVQTLTSDQVDDGAKERIIRGQSLKLLKETAVLAIKFAIIFVSLFSIFILFTTLWPQIEEPLIKSATSATDITFITITTACYIWFRNAIWKKLQSA